MKVPDIIKQAARDLRKNMTPAEKVLWNEIRKQKVSGKEFQRQKPIFLYFDNNSFPRYIIVDFICLKDKLVIEIDGSIHNNKNIIELDKVKEELLVKRGYKIIRFTNKEVLEDMQKIINIIQENCK